METEGALLCSQETATSPYPEWDEFSQYWHTQDLVIKLTPQLKNSVLLIKMSFKFLRQMFCYWPLELRYSAMKLKIIAVQTPNSEILGPSRPWPT
jgi:hypothetical protein